LNPKCLNVRARLERKERKALKEIEKKKMVFV
jgi:hypothetical protein